ncbi:unnamed protein product [Strongylus vulgaris]|uniref:Uncharacterized protein n=1 Tax=Strongylus vulgaris TaxID=40348 RepID=A0A3P7IW21_STRVU|nr:unnamed protein product [Strongylus vulgaris]
MRSMSRLRDPVDYVSNAKHRWTGHIMRRTEDRWTLRTLKWIPRKAKRSREINDQLVTNNGSASRTSPPQFNIKIDDASERQNGWKQCCGLHDK